jgi:Carboxypeptidase regulatory-like domain
MKKLSAFVVILCFGLFSAVALAQDIATKGSIGGKITDQNGAAIPGATVTATGGLNERTAITDSSGSFKIDNLTPGAYSLKVSNTGFKTTAVPNVEVLVGKESSLALKLEPGEVSATVTVTGGGAVDSATTAVSSNLNDQLFKNIPVQRGISSLFYLAPGTTDGLGGGRDNPSISGGSALDNLYIADGVNITDSAFGGIGTFSRSYGALGTGINSSFIKEVQVKTAGFEPQYGQSQGGIVNIITQSGSKEYHGAIYGFAQPKSFEATRKQQDEPNRFNKAGKLLHEEGYDVGADVGGYVPGARNSLFFFGSFNPTVRRQIVRGAEKNAADPVDFGLRTLRGPQFANRTRAYNYAGKVEWLVNSNHQVTFSIFGDPSKTNLSSWRTLVTDNTTADSILDYGTRNMSVRYNGTLSPTVTFNASLGLGKSRFNETGFANLNNISDRRGSDAGTIQGVTGFQAMHGNYSAVGLGFFEPTVSKSKRADFNLTKTHSMWGQHSLGLGYTFQRGNYDGSRLRSGPTYTIPAGNSIASGHTTNAHFRLRFRTPANCPTCPLFPVLLNNGTTALVPVRLQVYRAEFDSTDFTTYSNYHAWYAQDTWKFNKYITGLFGLRWEQERLVGSPGPTGQRIGYTFTDQWAPRIGVTVDPLGRGKTKAYYNYGRFFEYIPLDLAERSLSAEKDWIGATFAPESVGGLAVVNQYGTVNPIIDAAHQITGPTGLSTGDPANPIVPGTKLGFTDEHTVGFEQQLPNNFTLSVRYIDRRAKRIIEDAASVSPEATLADAPLGAGIGQVYYIGNISPTLDAAINLVPFLYTTGGPIPAGCAQSGGVPLYNYNAGAQSVCWAQTGIDPATDLAINTPDGKPDGFPLPVRNYKALEIEVNRRFNNGWQGFFNWRIASLKGNFEGHLRNDNGQTDPAISSLFDFTQGDLNLLGDQFAVGPLNTDRKHIVNVYGSYAFGKERGFNTLNGLNLGFNFHVESGLPISEYLAHPAYLNAGEIPVGGRGKLGRTDTYARVDAHVDYVKPLTENTRLKFVADFFNVFNSTKVRFPTQFKELDAAAPNIDFLKPQSFYNPFNMRLGVRFEF